MREGWKYKRLGEIAYYPNLRVSVSDLSAEDYVGVENLIKDRGGVSFGTSKPNIESAIAFSNDDILIGNIRPYLRKIWLANKEGGASGDIVLIRIRNEWAEYISPAYLFKVMSSERFFEYDNANTKGAKMPRGDRKSILDFVVPVPPLPEQERIVAELDLLTGIIDKQKAQLGELDTLAQSIFYDMFGDPVENEKGWATKQLRTIIQVKGRVGWKGYKKEDLRDSGPLAIGGGHITDSGEIDLSNPVFLSQEKYEESPEIMIETGDLILVQRGTIGKVGLIKYDIGQATINPCVLILRPYSINNVYALHFFLSKSIQECLKKLVRGVAQPMITQQQVNSIEIPVPPLLLQQSFAQKIQSIESQKESINRSIAETQKLFDYTMDKYFG